MLQSTERSLDPRIFSKPTALPTDPIPVHAPQHEPTRVRSGDQDPNTLHRLDDPQPGSEISMTFQKIEALDRRKAAIHECGHAFVAWHYEMYARPTIRRNCTENPSEEKTWIGTTRYDPSRLTPQRHRRLAIGGPLAELMDDPSVNEDELEYALEESFFYDEWSHSDYEGAQGWTRADFRAVSSILKRNWKALLEEARLLMECAA